MGPVRPYPSQDMVTLLDQLRQACQDLTGRSIRASAESSQWRARLAITHSSLITNDLALAYNQHATQDAAYWRRLRHQWACRYSATAVSILRATLTPGSPDAPPPPAPDSGGQNWATDTTLTCPTLPDPTDLTTRSPSDDARIAQAHQAVTEAADAARIIEDLDDEADTPAEVTKAAGQLTDRLLTYATAVHAAARNRLTPPATGPHL